MEYINAHVTDHHSIEFYLIDYPDIVFDITMDSVSKLKILYNSKSTMIAFYNKRKKGDEFEYVIIFKNNNNVLECKFSEIKIGLFPSVDELIDDGIDLIPEVSNELFNKLLELYDLHNTTEDL